MAIKAQKKGMLVLGASGKLGRMVSRIWQDSPREDTEIIPVFRNGNHGQGGIVWQPGEVPPTVGPIGTVAAFWGITPGPHANLRDNTRLALAAMELGQAVGADRVLHCSSVAVYGAAEPPLREDTPCHPANPYGVAKLDMEQAVLDWVRRAPEAPRPCFMRIGNVAGAESLFAALKRGGPVTLDRFADRTGPSRSYIGPEDLAKVTFALSRCDLAQLPVVVNVAAPRPTAMADLARAAGREVIWRPAPEGALQMVQVDTTRLDALVPIADTAAAAETLVAQWHRWGEPE